MAEAAQKKKGRPLTLSEKRKFSKVLGNLTKKAQKSSPSKPKRITRAAPLDDEKAVYDYEEKQKIYYYNNLIAKLRLIKSDSLDLLIAA